MKILAFVADAFGGHGGMALYNRDVLMALCNHPEVSNVCAVPRHVVNKPEPYPDNLQYDVSGTGGIVAYLFTVFKLLISNHGFGLVLCGLINMLPLAWLVAKILRVPLVLEIYGVDAWSPPRRTLSRILVSRVDLVISISDHTKTKFLQWSNIPKEKVKLLPNAIHLEEYGINHVSVDLVNRYELAGKKVLLTFGRLVSKERAKGFDEVLDVLPELIQVIPNIAYLIAGDGPYRGSLERKVKTLGLEKYVVFTGLVKEEEKADVFRLADAYVMPSRGEGFGFVFLEAMACGVPVIASKADGSREAVLDGELGKVVDPDNRHEIMSAILEILKQPERVIPQGLEHFSYTNFERRLHLIIDDVTKCDSGGEKCKRRH